MTLFSGIIKFLFIVFPVFLISSFSYCQDIHFSQYYASPLSMNPASTGYYKGDWRFMNNFRNQWKAISVPYRTISVGYDRQFYIYNENISAGLFFINDQSSNAALTVNKFFISGAWHKSINYNNLHIGFQAGYVLKSFSADKLTFPDQYDMSVGYFNQLLSNNEPSLNENLDYIDFNTGIIWSRKFRIMEPVIGYSIFHINRPGESFFGENNKLPVRHICHIDVNFDIGSKFYIIPRLFYMSHKKANDFLSGINIGYYLPESFELIKAESVFIGSYMRDGYERNTDAFFPVAGIKFTQLEIGISYDINISELHQATDHRGAFEISLIYIGLSTLPDQITIPCDRY